jgi:hypothetical protein
MPLPQECATVTNDYLKLKEESIQLPKVIRRNDELGGNFPVDPHRRTSPFDYEVCVNVRILLKSRYRDNKVEGRSVLVPTGLEITDLTKFQEFCLNTLKNGHSHYPHSRLAEIIPAFQVRRHDPANEHRKPWDLRKVWRVKKQILKGWFIV